MLNTDIWFSRRIRNVLFQFSVVFNSFVAKHKQSYSVGYKMAYKMLYVISYILFL